MRRAIINFHGLGTPQRALERDEDRYWVAPEILDQTLELAQKHADRVRVEITFDDGNASDFELGLPILIAHGAKAAFFVLSDRMDQPGSLSTAQVQAMAAQGHEVGSHGAAHVDWRSLDLAGQAREWDTARARISTIIGQPIRSAAIPFGSYNGTVVRELKARGYTAIYSSDGGAARAHHYPIPRTSVRADMTVADVEAIILGRESFKSAARRKLAMAIKRRF